MSQARQHERTQIHQLAAQLSRSIDFGILLRIAHYATSKPSPAAVSTPPKK